LSGSGLKNNPHSSAINISFGLYSLRSYGNTPIFRASASSITVLDFLLMVL
jgi:hypothetical protein